MTDSLTKDMDGKDLEDLFQSAANYLPRISEKISNEELLYFYSRYKQATCGLCNVPKPAFWELKAKQKWEAWQSLGNLSSTDAMRQYVGKLTELYPEWELEVEKKKPYLPLGPSVSTLQNPEDVIQDCDKTVFDWCKEGNTEKVASMLTEDKVDVNNRDENGMSLLHWAADRGFEKMVNLLLSHNAQIDLQDNDGQTALHYAVSCEHTSVITSLMSHGASTKIADNDGLVVGQLTELSHIQDLLLPPR